MLQKKYFLQHNYYSWTTQGRKLHYPYKHPSAFNLVDNTTGKNILKKLVKRTIHQYWMENLRQETGTKRTLQYLNKTICNIGKVHLVWRCGTDPVQCAKATTKATLLVQRYALAGTYINQERPMPTMPRFPRNPHLLHL